MRSARGDLGERTAEKQGPILRAAELRFPPLVRFPLVAALPVDLLRVVEPARKHAQELPEAPPVSLARSAFRRSRGMDAQRACPAQCRPPIGSAHGNIAAECAVA